MRWHLIGIAVQTDPTRPDPADEIASSRTSELPACYRYWSGRWILIGNGELHLDAAGLVGCYYLIKNKENNESRPWISSSPGLLAELSDTCMGCSERHELRPGSCMNWFPLPRSGFASIAHLLPSQLLCLKDRAIHNRHYFQSLYSWLSYEQILAKLEMTLLTFMQRMHRAGRTVWLALTAGIDSRLLLAVISKAKIPVRTFTLEYKGMSLADRLLTSKIAGIAGLDHVFVRTKKFDKRKAALYDAHTGGTHAELDREFLARNQWRFVNKGDLILLASCFEVGRCYWWHKLPWREIPSQEHVLRAFGEDPSSSLGRGIAEWLEWIKEDPRNGFDWRDRFYIEQRLAGWLSSVMKSFDLTELEHLNPLSSIDAFELLLSIPQKQRANGQHHIDLIRRMAPELLDVPINPRYNYFNRSTRLYWGCYEDLLYPIKYTIKFLNREGNKLKAYLSTSAIKVFKG